MLDPVAMPDMPLTRPVSVVSPPSETLPSFILGSANRSYKHQYANIYFIRLRKLKEHVERNARQRWQNVKGNPQMVKRVLDVTKGHLCWIIGTVYMDMPLKPNILQDIGRDFSIPPPPPPPKYRSPDDSIVLEDESGRISLVGDRVMREQLVTGIIVAALGIETPDGGFEVIDVCFPGMAPQAHISRLPKSGEDMDVDDPGPTGSWIALLSGLELSASHAMSSATELHLQLLVEHILAESGCPTDQQLSSQISRVFFVGNSMLVDGDHSRTIRHNSSTNDPGPLTSSTSALSKVLQEIALAVPIHILPGASDPSGVILPQQPMPRALFGEVRKYENFSCETNPTWLTIDGRTLLLTSGQTLDDIYKYLDTDDRLEMASRTLEWRHMAPTAPDTLWCHPYSTQDPFILPSTPNIYVIGNQPSFSTSLITSTAPAADSAIKRDHEGHVTGAHIKCRVVLLPKFCESPMLVLVHTGTLECKTIQVGVDVALLPHS